MFQRFYPGRRADSAYEIDYGQLYENGVRGLIYDIDNTLVPHGAPADHRARELFARLKDTGFEACLLSNNGEERVRTFNRDIRVHYICNAHKPSVKNYRAAMELMGSGPDSTVFIGDQLFTDIYGANRAGIPTILVKPIHPKEEIQIVFKRYLEKIVLFFYERHQKKESRQGGNRP